MDRRLELPANTVHVWYATVDVLAISGVVERALAILDPSERSAYQRFLVEGAKNTYLVAHALCRLALSAYCDVAPAAWRFLQQPRGKPYLVGPADAGELLQFNLSHSKRSVLCGVARATPLGVDIEDDTRKLDPSHLAPSVLTAREWADCQQHALVKQRFLQYWTIKEAYLKAQGQGIAEGLIHLEIDLGDGTGVVDVRTLPSGSVATGWCARLLPVMAQATAAAVVAHTAGPTPSFVLIDGEKLLLG